MIGVVFFSAIPTVMDRWPKWKTRSAARRLAQDIGKMKREASIERTSYRLQFVEGGRFEYFIEKVKEHFEEVKLVKPPASRSKSSEMYVLALDMRAHD